MTRFKSFVNLTLFGGLLVILPLTVFILVIGWLLSTITDLFTPISEPLLRHLGLHPILSELLVILALLAFCFVIGLSVRTTVGQWLHDFIDRILMRIAPGYRSIREIIHQLLGGTNVSILKGDVVLAKIMGPQSPVTVTGIVTSRHPDGYATVYVPTAPFPASGLTYHLPESCLEVLKGISVEQAMRSIIACGAGSGELIARSRAVQMEDATMTATSLDAIPEAKSAPGESPVAANEVEANTPR